MQSVLLWMGTCLLLLPALTLAFGGTDDASDGGYDRVRRGWSMMRLGRGLQMLRLGKRAPQHPLPSTLSSPSLPLSENAGPATPEQMRALLSALLEESRDEARRQPPLPRYGRELEVAQDSSSVPAAAASDADVYPLLGGGAYFQRVLPVHHYNNRIIQASRFKRSTVRAARNGNRFGGADADQVSDFDQSLEASRIRAVALPRIGRYLGHMYKFRPAKAVPAPRIGRQQQDYYPGSVSKGFKVKQQQSSSSAANVDAVISGQGQTEQQQQQQQPGTVGKESSLL